MILQVEEEGIEGNVWNCLNILNQMIKINSNLFIVH